MQYIYIYIENSKFSKQHPMSAEVEESMYLNILFCVFVSILIDSTYTRILLLLASYQEDSVSLIFSVHYMMKCA